MKPQSMRRQRGQAVVETSIAILVFGVFLLGIFQAILFYRVKSVVDYAALEAARSGATHFAQMGEMRKGFARGLMPLYAHKPDNLEVAKAYGEALIAAYNPLDTDIQIISPTRAAFADWAVPQFDGVKAIPNDSLMFRPATPGGSSGLTVQDANVLKIRVVYGYKMIVPVIDRIVVSIFRNTLYRGMSGKEIAMLESGRLPIVSQAVVRMQTPIRDPSLLSDGAPPPAGGGGSGAGGGDDGGTDDSGGGGGGGNQPPDHVCT